MKGKIHAEATEKIEAIAKQALLPPAMGLALKRFLVVKPKTSSHRPGESDGEQSHQLTELVRVSEMRRFEIEASGLERREESLDAPATGVVPQRGLGSRVDDEDEQFTIDLEL